MVNFALMLNQLRGIPSGPVIKPHEDYLTDQLSCGYMAGTLLNVFMAVKRPEHLHYKVKMGIDLCGTIYTSNMMISLSEGLSGKICSRQHLGWEWGR